MSPNELDKQETILLWLTTFICFPNCGLTQDRPWGWHRTCAQALKSHSIMAGAYTAAAATADNIASHKNISSTQFITRNKRRSKGIPQGKAEANDKALDKVQGKYSWRLKHAHPAKKHINHALKVCFHHLRINWPIDQFPRVDRVHTEHKNLSHQAEHDIVPTLISCSSSRQEKCTRLCQARRISKIFSGDLHPDRMWQWQFGHMLNSRKHAHINRHFSAHSI